MTTANIHPVPLARAWWDSFRWVALPNSGMSIVLGGIIAFVDGKFDWLRFIVAFIGVMCVHLGTNLLDDYADLKIAGFLFREGVQKKNETAIRTAKAPYIQDGTIKMSHALLASWILFIAAIACGIFLVIVSGWQLLVIAGIAAVICYFYSMPPLKLCYRGMGELVVILSMGPGICLGVYWAVTGTFSWTPLLLGLALGCMIGLILYNHSIMDYKPDIAINKKTTVALLGGTKPATRLVPVIIGVAYGAVALGMALRILPLTMLVVLLCLPISIKLIILMNRLAAGDYSPTKVSWWMGPMEWKNIEGHEWFMVRWLLTRNVLITFALLVYAGYLLSLI
jgi:1,4-dihydroxy-2-naphthoate polyprenyltransferase